MNVQSWYQAPLPCGPVLLCSSMQECLQKLTTVHLIGEQVDKVHQHTMPGGMGAILFQAAAGISSKPPRVCESRQECEDSHVLVVSCQCQS